ncbi:MAG: LytR/AlgR family response regulator transcription factor [Saprospiraceae bacterium]
MNVPLRCLIVDDEKLAQELLASYVQKMPNLELVATCSTALAAMQVLQTESIDLLFLDIQMPDLTGLDFLRNLRQPPATILTTAYSEYALEGYELNVVDYLLKPIEFQRFFQAVSKVQLPQNKTPQIIDNQTTINQKSTTPEYFFVKSDSKIIKIEIANILYVEALQKYIRIHTKTERIIALMSISKMLEELPATQFVRIHRSYLIQLRHIENVEGNMVRINGKTLPISKGQRELFMERLREQGLNF